MRLAVHLESDTGLETALDTPRIEETAPGRSRHRQLREADTVACPPNVETVIYQRHNHHFAIRASIFAHQFGSYTRCINMNADMLRIDWPVPPVLRKTCKCLAESIVGARISGIMAG